MQTMATSDRAALLVRVAIALACGIPILVTLTLAAISETAPGLWFFLALLSLSPIAQYVWKVRGLLRSVVSGAIVGALTAWWVVSNGTALRNLDDGLELVTPILAVGLQFVVVAAAIGRPPIPPRPDNESSERTGQ